MDRNDHLKQSASEWLTSPRVSSLLARYAERDAKERQADTLQRQQEAQERAALISIPDSILAKRCCVTCGKGENEVPITEMAKRQRQCDDCYEARRCEWEDEDNARKRGCFI